MSKTLKCTCQDEIKVVPIDDLKEFLENNFNKTYPNIKFSIISKTMPEMIEMLETKKRCWCKYDLRNISFYFYCMATIPLKGILSLYLF